MSDLILEQSADNIEFQTEQIHSELMELQDADTSSNVPSFISPKYVYEIGRSGAYDTATLCSASTFGKNMNYYDITDEFIESLAEYLIEPGQLVFRFLCSSQCENTQFRNNINVFKLIRHLLGYQVLMEFSDFSLRSLISDWNNQIPDIVCPWKLLPKTTSGSFTMTGLKSDFINAEHPTLRTMGQLSENDIRIEFHNAGGTILYDINELSPNVPKVISRGHIASITETQYLVHTSVKIRESTIIAMNSHWCNLSSVESSVDRSVLRDFILRTEGEESAMEFDNSMDLCSGDAPALKREISESVRRMVSGQTSKKKTKFNLSQNYDDYDDDDEETCSCVPTGRQNSNAN